MDGGANANSATRRIAGFATAYFIATSLTISLTRYDGGVATVWLGTGIGAALLTGLRRQAWPAALITLSMLSALSTCLFGFGPRLAAQLAIVNVCEAWLTARLLLFARPDRDWLESVGGMLWMVAIAGVSVPALGAVCGGLAVVLATGESWPHHAGNWWAAHGLGTLLCLPMILLAPQCARAILRSGRPLREAVEFAGHMALVILVSIGAIMLAPMPMLFLPIVPVLLAALRCGCSGAAMGTVVVAGVTLWAQRSQHGSISALPLSPTHSVLYLQFYLATVFMLALPMAVGLHRYRMVLAELAERKALKRLIADHSDDALLNLDEHGTIRFASPASERLTGRDDLVGKPLTVFFDPLDELLVRALLTQCAASPGETRMLERPVLRGDEQLWLEAKLRAFAPEDRPDAVHGYVVTIRDVTARKLVELDAVEAAETDPLTGLPNRRALLRRLNGALEHASQRPFAFAILDLDHFKRVNDHHGHFVGDTVLREVTGVMRRLSGMDCFFARLGGEEFALLSAGRDFAASVLLCERLRMEVSALSLTTPQGIPLTVTASIGVARIAAPCTTAQALQAADTLLYRAKDAGRNRVEATAEHPTGQGHRRAA